MNVITNSSVAAAALLICVIGPSGTRAQRVALQMRELRWAAIVARANPREQPRKSV